MPPSKSPAPGLSDEAVVARLLVERATDRQRPATPILAQYRVEARALFSYARRMDRRISCLTRDDFGLYICYPIGSRAVGVLFILLTRPDANHHLCPLCIAAACLRGAAA